MSYERILGYVTFLISLKDVYPIPIAKKVFEENINNMTNNEITEMFLNRNLFTNKLYSIEKEIYSQINKQCISYNDRCKSIEDHRASCSKNTCRVTH